MGKYRLVGMLFLLGIFVLGGCSSHRTMVILMPDQHGEVGSAEVVTEGGRHMLTESRQAVLVKDRRLAPSELGAMDEARIAELFRDAIAAEPPVPEKFILYFKTGTTRLTKASKMLVPSVFDAIHKRNSQDISINGHTDRVGTRPYNQDLSLQRAHMMRDLLISAGIAPECISSKSHGEGNPLVHTPDGVPEPRNRRVEVIVR